MTSFIKEVIVDIQNKGLDFSELTFILPSKRAGVFLTHELSQIVNKTIFSPSILSIETFVEELSQLKAITNTELLFEFYNVYADLTYKKHTESFESFSKWAQVLLQDFNEIDRYLIPQENIFNYLSAIKETEHWSLDNNKTEFIEKYLSFWNKLNDYYTQFSDELKSKNIGYQGLIYREAVENLEVYIQNNQHNHFVFLGFNALNASEETIIQELLQNDLASIYWDTDEAFMNTPNHNAAYFTNRHKKNWNYFKNNPFNWVSKNYSTKKNISVFGISKQIGQAKYIGTLLNELSENDISFKNTAIVLGDETLLTPMLNSLPDNVNELNITMGFPLNKIPLANLFEQLFRIHKTPANTFYYKDVVSLLAHPSIQPLLNLDNIDYASKIIDVVTSQNLIYSTKAQLNDIIESEYEIISLLFSNWENNVTQALKNCTQLIYYIKTQLDKNKKNNAVSLEYLYRFNQLFNQVTLLNSKYNHIKDITTLYSVYKELLSTENIDFQGEPLQGLQIMGMLESRVLDFETVIISSVNEGILPSGKSNNSFIPFDVKLENKLPTYKEKDAVYTYHFFRLLQRAKNIYILYNTEADVLTGGEKSRFITQLELEGIHNITHSIVAPKVPVITKVLNRVEKNSLVEQQLKTIAKKGFSPSSLTNYIRNPIDFYYQKILKIKEHNEVEETVAANTLGTVVHNTLEDFYKPLIGQFLTVEEIKNMKPKISKRVTHHFKNEYKMGNITSGKNLIVFEIAKRYVSNFLDLEIKALQDGNSIKIIAIEAESNVPINIPEIKFPINLIGKVDRVDEFNGTTRIIDYKTGKVELNKVEITNWEDITTDYTKYSKSFQILTYALMMQQQQQINLPVEAGIISFKNLNAGFLKFAKKDNENSRNKDTLITQETLDAFQIELKKLILEICNPEIDFIEKEIS